MKKFLITLAIIFGTIAITSEPARSQETFTPAQAARIIQSSTVALVKNNNEFCTATKIDPRMYLTAKHCVGQDTDFGLEYKKLTTLWPRYITLPWGTKSDGERKPDWAIIETTFGAADIQPAKLGCAEEIYLGQPVAVYGYSSHAAPSFSVGYVSSLEPGEDPWSFDYAIDVQAAPGSSGSAVMSLDTGAIIGVLVEGIAANRVGFYLIGVQEIKTTPVCLDRGE